MLIAAPSQGSAGRSGMDRRQPGNKRDQTVDADHRQPCRSRLTFEDAAAALDGDDRAVWPRNLADLVVLAEQEKACWSTGSGPGSIRRTRPPKVQRRCRWCP